MRATYVLRRMRGIILAKAASVPDDPSSAESGSSSDDTAVPRSERTLWRYSAHGRPKVGLTRRRY